MSEPIPPVVVIRYRNGMEVTSPVKYMGWGGVTELGWKVLISSDPLHRWLVVSEVPFDSDAGDELIVLRDLPSTLPFYVHAPTREEFDVRSTLV